MNLGAGFKQRALMKRDKLPNPEVWESEHITGKGKKTLFHANHWFGIYSQTFQIDNYGHLMYVTNT